MKVKLSYATIVVVFIIAAIITLTRPKIEKGAPTPRPTVTAIPQPTQTPNFTAPTPELDDIIVATGSGAFLQPKDLLDQ